LNTWGEKKRTRSIIFFNWNSVCFIKSFMKIFFIGDFYWNGQDGWTHDQGSQTFIFKWTESKQSNTSIYLNRNLSEEEIAKLQKKSISYQIQIRYYIYFIIFFSFQAILSTWIKQKNNSPLQDWLDAYKRCILFWKSDFEFQTISSPHLLKKWRKFLSKGHHKV